MKPSRFRLFSVAMRIFLLVVPCVSIGSVVFSDGLGYFRPYYTNEI